MRFSLRKKPPLSRILVTPSLTDIAMVSDDAALAWADGKMLLVRYGQVAYGHPYLVPRLNAGLGIDLMESLKGRERSIDSTPSIGWSVFVERLYDIFVIGSASGVAIPNSPDATSHLANRAVEIDASRAYLDLRPAPMAMRPLDMVKHRMLSLPAAN